MYTLKARALPLRAMHVLSTCIVSFGHNACTACVLSEGQNTRLKHMHFVLRTKCMCNACNVSFGHIARSNKRVSFEIIRAITRAREGQITIKSHCFTPSIPVQSTVMMGRIRAASTGPLLSEGQKHVCKLHRQTPANTVICKANHARNWAPMSLFLSKIKSGISYCSNRKLGPIWAGIGPEIKALFYTKYKIMCGICTVLQCK